MKSESELKEIEARKLMMTQTECENENELVKKTSKNFISPRDLQKSRIRVGSSPNVAGGGGSLDRLNDIRENSMASTYGPNWSVTSMPTIQDFKAMEEIMSPLEYYHGYICREDLIGILKKYGDYCVRISVHAASAEKKTVREKANKSMVTKLDILLANRDFVIAVNCNKKKEAEKETANKEKSDDKDDKKSKRIAISHIKNMVLRRTDGKLSIEPGKLFRTLNELVAHYKVNTGTYKGHEFQLLQPIGLTSWEFRHKEIELSEKKLGEGAFGEVRVGTIRVKEGGLLKSVNVALKNAESVTRDQVQELLHEGRVMRYLDHKNVLRSYGVAVLHEPLYLMSELCGCGALREYLRENAKTLTLNDRLQFCLGSARGVEYLHSQRLIHRDLAVRNVLLTDDKTPKVSDFGLAKVTDRYEMKETCKIPVRYLAPETLDTFVFTPKSDVFSFGMVMWEIFENGVQPHDGKNAQTIKDLTKRQQFLKLNEMAPEPLRKLVSDKIFVSDPENRCNMSAVVQALEKIVGK
ncbi:unnamed protein product [Caenorhabditis bovis]|uniref:Tyrosine-protein kinase n=1 Tax=Caenorhabditis bovis TaxID=2654633 RepID=A0A8S1FD69_9PELO|nr:unnamed protein product [Caenorhabditis bovis]